jgi:hypothetical protein
MIWRARQRTYLLTLGSFRIHQSSLNGLATGRSPGLSCAISTHLDGKVGNRVAKQHRDLIRSSGLHTDELFDNGSFVVGMAVLERLLHHIRRELVLCNYTAVSRPRRRDGASTIESTHGSQPSP